MNCCCLSVKATLICLYIIYYHLLNFNLSKALKSKDPFVEKNLSALKFASYIAKFFILINILVAFQLVANGEHFFYQVAATFFMGFIFIRLLIVFNKEIDYHANGARYVQNISNSTVIWVFIYILGCACFSWIVYSIVYKGLLISKQ